ncbi:MAG TPA: MarR family transcriptional regulator [Caulobacteraceae bacterium]|nr:MarR family transcriptional regulator [Caulobacteraceae bacterium]
MARLKDRPDVEFFACVTAIGRLADQRLERAAPDGLSLASLSVLNHLAQWGGTPTPNELAQAFQLSKPAMTNTLQRLQGLGFIEIAADPDDGRRKRIALTESGLSAQRAALLSIRPKLEALRDAFGASDFEAALPLLRRLRAWLDANP